MSDTFKPDPAARVRMRTDGPPVPIYWNEDPPSYRPETFMAMFRRRLPWLLIATAMAVFVGLVIGQAFAQGY
jgi:hypothetical protein